MYNQFKEKLSDISFEKFGKSLKTLDKDEIYSVIGELVNEKCDYHRKEAEGRRVAYFSIEYLIGRLLWSNLYNMKNTDYVQKALADNGHSLSELEDIEDYAFGNGGLGRLAACFLDSAASCELPLDGYGIRYKYGLFKQSFSDSGEQIELPDNWQRYKDAFAIKKDNESVNVEFSDYTVKAVPYDYNIIGYSFKRINTLRLFECKAVNCDEKDAEKIYEYLYPDDSNYEGKKLRLRQQYFMVSASLQTIVNKYGLDDLEDRIKIQLNDTHPVLAIPELINICVKNQMSFDEALAKAKKIFAYTNHTVMPEALEVWDVELIREVLPQIYGIIQKINDMLKLEFNNNESISVQKCAIIEDNKIKMANLACYVCSHINGVAGIHTDIIKKETLSQWYSIYPDKFNNKTNGISQRRWLGLCNKSLSEFLSKLCGCEIVEETENIIRLETFKDDNEVLNALSDIKSANKRAFCDYVKREYNITLDENSIFIAQIKRIHEYKRQLMAIFGAVYLYQRLKNGELADFPGVTFIFSGKAAPGYKIAKSIIKYINNVARVVNNDPDTNGKLKIIFLPNYNVSLAEKIIPATDVSLQISLAGTEASGTGNMKFMMNGAVTLGTYDGANIEICREAGEENNYIFGLRENEVGKLESSYSPKTLYNSNPEIKNIIDTLVTGKFGEKYGFMDIYDSLLNSDDPDRYMVLADLMNFIETLKQCIYDKQNKNDFNKKSLMNIAHSAYFSADRTVKEYAEDIWFKE